MPSATKSGDSNVETRTNGTNEMPSGSLDLTVLGLNSGTSMVIILYIHKVLQF
jgi:hypothetical protein